MSSKSRKNTSKSSQALSVPGDEHKASSAQDGVHVAGLDIPDDVLHVPKGETSPLRFILSILLLVVLLVIFVVPSAFMGLGSGGGESPDFFTWERPGVGTQSFTERELELEAQAMQTALGIDFFLGIQLGVNAQEMDLNQMARLLVLDQLALDAGIRVPTIDLGKHLRQIPEQLSMFQRDWPRGEEGVQRLREILVSNPNAEPNVRRLLRIKRLIDISAFAAGQAAPKSIVEAWESEHTELAFDYVALASGDFEEAARAELPDDVQLEAWLMALEGADKFKREDLSIPESRRIELVSYREGADNTKLLEAYPLEEGSDREALALDYYTKNNRRRFLKPDDTGDIAQFEDEGIQAACLVEAEVKQAMERWLVDLKAELKAGGEPNLLVASNPFGLSYLRTESLNREAMEQMEEFADNPSFMSNAFFTPAGAFAFSVSIGPKGPVILRVAEVTERVLPPFVEIRDKVAELWIAERAPVLGREKLEALRDGFEVLVPETEAGVVSPADAALRHQASEEVFQAALAEAGFSSQRRDWLDIGGSTSADPQAEDENHKFLNVSGSLKRLVENEVAVEFDQIQKRLYLVRCAGRRPLDVARMSPKDFERYQDQGRRQVSGELARSLDQEFLFKNVGLRFTEESGVPNPGDEDYGKEN